MYLIVIFFLIALIPFLVMPKQISAGKKSPYEVVVHSVMITCAVAVFMFMLASMTGKGLFSQLHGTVELISEAAANDPTVIKALSMEEMTAGERLNALIGLYDAILQLMPAFIMMLSTLMSYLAYVLLSKSLIKRGNAVLMPKFREFTFPGGAVMALMLVYLFSWFLSSTGAAGNNAFFVNMDLIFDFMFFIQGMSVVFMLFYVKHIPKAFAVILALIMWNIFIGRSIFVMLGIFDLIMGFKLRLLVNSRRK